MAANKNAQIAQSVLAAVGGKENIVSVTHCMTRLRFNLKDMSIPKDDEVKAIKGTMGVARSSGQYQVIVGTNVDNVCAELCTLAGLEQAATVSENLDAPKEPLTLKKVGSNIMAYLSGSLTPIIPVGWPRPFSRASWPCSARICWASSPPRATSTSCSPSSVTRAITSSRCSSATLPPKS